MKAFLITSLVAAILVAPVTAHAQHGHGGGGHAGGGHPGGGYRGGAMGHAVAPHGGGAPMGHMAGGGAHFAGRPEYHGGWYHGNWGGGWGYRPWGWGYGGYYGGWGPGFGWGFGLGAATVGIGMGLGSPWGWGYYSYYNPYWVAPVGGATYINYSQPVVYQAPPSPPPQQYPPTYGAQYGVQANTSAPPPPAAQSPARTEALGIFDNARSLFTQGKYQAALTQTDRAIALLPNDSVMHEFRALCLFAMKDYQQSAAAVYAVTSAGPGWDWTTVSNLYPNINTYTGQLRALEAYCEENAKASGPRFLLAYHYVLAGHNEQAAGLLAEVVRLEPKDQLSAQLLKGLTSPPGQKPGPADSQVAAAPVGQPVDEVSIVGDWKANRADGSNFELNLTGDKRFSWRFDQQGKQQEMTGTYTLANNFLILTASDQNSLVGQVAMQPGNRLAFKLAGGNPAEPGLTFTR